VNLLPKNQPQPSSGVKFEIAGVMIIAAALLLVAGLLDFSVGRVGYLVAKVARYGFGVGAAGIAVFLLIIGLRYVTAHSHIIYSRRFIGYLLTYAAVLAMIHHFSTAVNQEILPEYLPTGGGLTGGIIVMTLRRFFAIDGTTIFLAAAIICSLLLATGFSLSEFFSKLKVWFSRLWDRIKKPAIADKAPNKSIAGPQLLTIDPLHPALKPSFYNQEKDEPVSSIPSIPEGKKNIRSVENLGPPMDILDRMDLKMAVEPAESAIVAPAATASSAMKYKIPSMSILKKASAHRNPRMDKEIAEHARTLEQTLESFGIQASVVHATQGPAVTRYELEPAPGVKISRIVSLSDDIALKLAAPSIRIEAPIPGKSVIGIEVPNKEVFGVTLREVLESSEYQSSSSLLTVALGKDITGQAIMADLAKMPHLLVAGATGSGKSICINILISSILFRAHPDCVKFLLIDPKVVELSNYNGIPHLVAPVVTEPKKAASALKWTVQEMERRYALFAAAGARDVTRYNEINPEEKLPLIVVIIDELADLMMVAPVDVEDSICRLAQMARASGIHLVIATQRPSVDVITGTIKANIPSRISFSVSSQIDSRTILDMAGAEKLLGKGDMLYYPIGATKPLRLQGAYISDSEIETLVKHIKESVTPPGEPEVPLFEELTAHSNSTRFDDELLEDSVKLVLETGQASVSLLQRKFRIGYTRAARLVDMMQEMQIVSAANGSKPREVIMNSEQIFSRYFQKNQPNSAHPGSVNNPNNNS
jgi:S-DNA-T family DNA segregation ATPase FtsK/SpoIIIE